MLALFVVATALANDPTTTGSSAGAKETFAAGQNATSVFEKTTLTKVGTVKSGDKTYEVRCATVNNAKTCSAYDDKGTVVATSTNVTTNPNNGFTATFPDTFAMKSVTYDVKK
jgi:hypothetical protein